MNPKNIFTNGKKFVKNDEGVSPVVGVILMVAITVVMAAIVASWSSTVKAPTTPTTVGLDITRSGNNITVVVTTIDPPASAPIPLLNITYYNYSNATGGLQFNQDYTNMTNADVGNSKTIFVNSSDLKRLTITATFKDSSKKVLYSQDT